MIKASLSKVLFNKQSPLTDMRNVQRVYVKVCYQLIYFIALFWSWRKKPFTPQNGHLWFCLWGEIEGTNFGNRLV